MKTFSDLERAIDALPSSDFSVSIDTSERRAIDDVPAELAKLYAKWGTLTIEVKESIWARPKELDVVPAWRFGFGFEVFPPGGPQRAFLRRAGARSVFVLTAGGVGTWREGEGVEEESFDAIECILRQIDDLNDCVGRIRLESMNADQLVEAGRRLAWRGPGVGPIVDALKGRPGAELEPHVREIVDALVPGEQFTMGALDIVAAAGREAFRAVADTILAHEGSRPWVVELLGKVADTSPAAIARYRDALSSDDDDEVDQGFVAVTRVAHEPASRALVPLLREKLPEWEPRRRASAFALLAQLGEPLSPLVSDALDDFDDDDLGALLRAMNGHAVGELAPRFLARLRAIDPKSRAAMETIEALVALGVEERPYMESVLREHFVTRGGRWQSRAEAILVRWTRP